MSLGSISEKLAMLPNTFEAKMTGVLLSGDWTSLCEPNILRVYLAFTMPIGSLVSIKIDNDPIKANYYTLNNASQILEFYLEKHRILQSLEWFAKNSGGGVEVSVTEVIYKGG